MSQEPRKTCPDCVDCVDVHNIPFPVPKIMTLLLLLGIGTQIATFLYPGNKPWTGEEPSMLGLGLIAIVTVIWTINFIPLNLKGKNLYACVDADDHIHLHSTDPRLTQLFVETQPHGYCWSVGKKKDHEPFWRQEESYVIKIPIGGWFRWLRKSERSNSWLVSPCWGVWNRTIFFKNDEGWAIQCQLNDINRFREITKLVSEYTNLYHVVHTLDFGLKAPKVILAGHAHLLAMIEETKRQPGMGQSKHAAIIRHTLHALCQSLTGCFITFKTQGFDLKKAELIEVITAAWEDSMQKNGLLTPVPKNTETSPAPAEELAETT